MTHSITVAVGLLCALGVQAAPQELISTNATWRFFKGRTEASAPDLTGWRSAAFADGAFEDAPAPFSYGEGYTAGTLLTDMQGQYSCLFLRRAFTITNVAEIAALRLGAIVDDGFVAWINGVEVQRVNVNANPVTYTSLAVNATEPVPFLTYDLFSVTNALVPGTNVIAVQVFNTSLGSSDLIFDASLAAILVDTNPPALADLSPQPGTVDALTQITVTFTEPVSGVNAGDLLVNGASATGLSGSGATYTFTFPHPVYGRVWITWAPQAGIVDLALPPNAFDRDAPGSTWFYDLRDAVPPTVVNLFPPPGATVRSLAQIEVTFSEPVANLTADDLRINGQPATALVVLPGPIHVFQFPAPAMGAVQVAWAPEHGITDLAAEPNAFVGTPWSYEFDPNAPVGDLVLNEISAANQTGLADEDGEAQDWIEIHNRGGHAVDLAGWSLSDDASLPGQWVFPARVLGAGQYLVVFASGKDRKNPTGANRLHTNFKLSSEGEFLGLYSPDSPRLRVSAFAPKFPEQRNNVSFGRDPGGNLRYFATPTPGAANGASTLTGLAAPVHFSVARGHFTQPFTLHLTTPTPGATIRYTINGSEPTLANSTPYLGSLRLSGTTLLRAAAFRADLLPSLPGTHSYLFNLPATYRTLPVISIVTDRNHLTGPLGIIGISNVVQQSDGTYLPADATGYHNPSKHGIAWERPTSVEWIRPQDNSGFQIDCGLRVQGSDYQRPRTTAASKFSFRLYFRGDYGPGRLEYPLFPLTSVESFDQVVLRAGFNEQNNPFIRDELTRRVSHDMGQVASHGTFAVVLVNGVAYASSPFYNPCERVHEEFLQSHLGGSDEWDVVGPTFAQGAGEAGVIDGDRADFRSLVSYINTQPVTSTPVYLEAARRLDLVNFVDYLLLNVYCAMGDWPQNNWRAGKDRRTSGPWRFIVWDGEWAMGIYGRGVTTNMFTNNGPGPTAGGLASTGDSEIAQMYQRLYQNPEFRLLWADRIHKQMFNGGALMDSNIVARFNQMKTELTGVIPSMNTDILTTWVPQRRGIVFGHFDQFGLMASSNAPAFSQHGGAVPRGFNVTLTAPSIGGTIYFTTNGADPRVMFSGAVAADAVAYTSPLSLGQTLTLRARTLNAGRWSALTEATFTVALPGVPLRITEIHYHPPTIEGGASEFIELQNVGGAALDLGGMSFDGITFRFNEGTVLTPGATLVLASDANPAAFAARYPGVNVAGYFGGALNNAGERITLLDRFGNTIVSVDYDDAGGWPTSPDGGGYSLAIIDPLGDPDDPANWRASAELGGSPGVSSSPPTLPAVRLNEVMAHNISAVNHAGTFPDWVELFNAGPAPADLSGWSLTDDGDARKFIFPASTTLAPGSSLVVWCDAATNTTPGLHTGFALDRDGDRLFLFDAATNRVDALSFGPQLTNYSVGRVGGEWVLTTPTTNAPNVAAATAPASNLVINEWLANSLPGQPDWIELYNRSATLPVALRGFSLATSNAVFQITSLSFVERGGYVVLLADEAVGPTHLDFRLPASGGVIVLNDPVGTEVNRVNYTVQTEGVSRGRLPDGSTAFADFPTTASPGAANYAATYGGPVFSEVLARNVSAITNAGGTPDFVELYNPGFAAWNLAGMSLSVGAAAAGEWVFPPGALLSPQSYLVIWCDAGRPASTHLGAYNTGRALDGESGGAYLFNAAGQLVNAIEYGFQVADRSIGLSGGQWRLLTAPTPAAPNTDATSLANVAALRINEWMARPATGPDWFELFNPTNLPADLGNLVLTDDPSSAGTNQFRVPPLSFIGAGSFVKWIADGSAGQGRNHVNFNLDAEGETLRIYATNGATVIDTLSFGAQRLGVSEGRLLDGTSNVVSFAGSPSPGEPNYLPTPHVVINEVLPAAQPAAANGVELHNPSSTPAAIGGWFLSDSQANFRKFRLPDDTVIPPGGFVVLPESQFSNASPVGFTLSAARGGELWLSEADAAGNLTGVRTGARFGAAEQGVSFGRHATRLGVDYVALSAVTLGGTNAAPRLGPVVINEIHYHPLDVTTALADDEFIELHNVTSDAVPLFDPAATTNRWRLAGGVDFHFPPNLTLTSGEFLLVLNFDPVANPAALASFRSRFNVPPNVSVLGPYGGRLDNAGDTVKLLKPGKPIPVGQPGAGFVPQVRVDIVEYTDAPPWPAGDVDGGGLSLQRRSGAPIGNDPENWVGAPPTAGAANGSGVVPPPVITQAPQSQTALQAGPAQFTVAAEGAGPLQFQWRFDGFELAGETNPTLALRYVILADEGDYDVFVSNPAGSVFSAPARLAVDAPPVILLAPQNASTNGGSNVVFTVLAAGSTPLSYQWRFNGVDLSGATSPTLLLSNLTLAQMGTYTVLVSNRVATTAASAALTVWIRPTFLLQPVGQTVPAGGSVSFSAAWTGTQPMGHRWRRGSVNLAFLTPTTGFTCVPLTNGYIWGSPTSSYLVLTNLSQSVTGNYTVVPSNALAQVVSATAPLTLLADTDGDGLPDDWENAHAGFNPNDPLDGARDEDGDGMSNAAEHFAGTDYRDANSYLRLDLSATGLAGLHFQAVSNRTYTVEFTDGLTPPQWQKLGDIPARTHSRPEAVLDFAPGSNRYYRLITPVQR